MKVTTSFFSLQYETALDWPFNHCGRRLQTGHDPELLGIPGAAGEVVTVPVEVVHVEEDGLGLGDPGAIRREAAVRTRWILGGVEDLLEDGFPYRVAEELVLVPDQDQLGVGRGVSAGVGLVKKIWNIKQKIKGWKDYCSASWISIANGYPTDHFLAWELWNPSHDVSELHKIRWSPDFGAQSLCESTRDWKVSELERVRMHFSSKLESVRIIWSLKIPYQRDK